jgi:hypothetical protein
MVKKKKVEDKVDQAGASAEIKEATPGMSTLIVISPFNMGNVSYAVGDKVTVTEEKAKDLKFNKLAE